MKATLTGHAENVDFFTPELAYADAAEHLPAILIKFDRAHEVGSALAYLDFLRVTVVAVPEKSTLMSRTTPWLASNVTRTTGLS